MKTQTKKKTSWNRKPRFQILALSSEGGLRFLRSQEFLLLYSSEKADCQKQASALANCNFPMKHSFACCLHWVWTGWQEVWVMVAHHHHSCPHMRMLSVSYKLASADRTEVADMINSEKAEMVYSETELITCAGEVAVGWNPAVQNAKSHAFAHKGFCKGWEYDLAGEEGRHSDWSQENVKT